jgi:hypothetical protein
MRTECDAYAKVELGARIGSRSFCTTARSTKQRQFSHSCDNSLCINPAHLFAGTHADNMADVVRKGRQARGPSHKGPTMEQRLRGAAHYASKVNEEDVREIRRLRAMGYTLTQLAQRFPLHPMTIGEIARKETWRHVA